MLLPSGASRAARDDAPEHGDGAIEQQTDETDVEQRDDDVADARAVPRIPDEEADADTADQHLARHDRKPREPDPDAQPGKDERRGRRQHDRDEILAAMEA